ncbi:hypothetical protein [Streptomyces sp. NPDC002671]
MNSTRGESVAEGSGTAFVNGVHAAVLVMEGAVGSVLGVPPPPKRSNMRAVHGTPAGSPCVRA